MGNKQTNPIQQNQQLVNYQRFITYKQDSINEDDQGKGKEKGKGNQIQIQPFECLNVSMDKKQVKQFQILVTDKMITVTKYFDRLQYLQIYISNAIKITKMLNIYIYDQLKFVANQAPFISHLLVEIKEFKPLATQFIRQSSLQKKIDLLQYVATFLKNVRNIYICPDFIAQGTNGFHLLNFSINKTYTPEKIFLGFLRWAFSDHYNFQICMTIQDMPSGMPIYLQQIFHSMQHFQTLKINEIQSQLKMVKDKMSFLMSRTDSFYACQYFNKIQKYVVKSDWIFLKLKHEIYFYHVKDRHSFMGKLIRKKKKKDIDDCHVTFDHEDLEILYVPQNAKFIVKASQFQFESSSSISDIEIKYKLPVKFKNCLICRARNGDIFLLQQYLYRFIPSTNKIIQETKRVSDYIFLSTTRQSSALIIKLSIDIFRNGIRVFYKNQDLILLHTGEEKTLAQISSIRIDIRHVIFCFEVYKGVFLMMASKNMWILDLNFQCFFSFATPTQIKKLASFTNYNHTTVQSKINDQIFTILNQPFKVDFSIQNDGNNATIKDNFLHILGQIQGHPYYLKYSFIHRIGALKLQGYHPLYVETPFQVVSLAEQKPQTQLYHFNFHEENSNIYKYRDWIYKGKLMIKVFDIKIRFEKTNYQVSLQIQKIEESLKDHIQKLNKYQRSLQKIQLVFLLYKIYQIYQYIFTNHITHKNISINHICFTCDKELKIHGWSEPPRNWHVSDYKDFLLVCFNIITYSTYEKLSDKIISKHQPQLQQFPIFLQKIQQAFKQLKTIQKKTQIQKNLQSFKALLQKQLSSVLHSIKTQKFLFSFQYKTPRMTMLNIETQKMKKITIVPQETVVEEFIFNETDQYAWNQEQGKLYIFTTAHQFFQLKIDVENLAEEKLILEDYEYLPQNINYCGFVYVKGEKLYSFGGIKKELDGRSAYCKKVYKFNWKNLTWEAVAELPQPRIDPHLVVSHCKKFIYVFGGLREHEQKNHLKIIKFNIQRNSCQLLIDKCSQNMGSNLYCAAPMKIFHLNERLQIFMMWSIEQGEYIMRYTSYTSYGFNIEIRLKNYSSDNLISRQSVILQDSQIHILRPYGKYTKIVIHKLECASLKNQTIYAI